MAKKTFTKAEAVKWQAFIDNIRRATAVDLSETAEAKNRRVKELEKPGNELKWMKYYFPNFCRSEFAWFHRDFIKRIVGNPRWLELLMWSRELAKSTITMLVVLYLCIVKKELKNVLLVSNSEDNARRLLLPYMLTLEHNQRLINDYGTFEKLGAWEIGEFTTAQGTAFRALGAGQSPRGTRHENWRVDCILIDDIDTDEECRNERRIKDKFKWIQEALFPTVSVSGNYRIIVCGNKIAKHCIVALMEKLADKVFQVNIRDHKGCSSWPEKNSEADIDAIAAKMTYSSFQKEFYNNPISEGTVFKEMGYKALPPLNQYKFLVCYTDPSFKDSKKNDYKATVLVGRWRDEYHVRQVFLEQTNTATMIDWHYQIAKAHSCIPVYYFMESNFLQDTLLEEFYKTSINKGTVIPITGDSRKKADKFTRIETLLEPLNRNGKLWLNLQHKNSPHMQRLEEQFLALEPGSSAHDDGPDAVEGAVVIINEKLINNPANISISARSTNTRRV